MIRQKIFNIFKKLNLDNPLEFARRILTPLCKDKLSEHIVNCKECRTCNKCDKKLSRSGQASTRWAVSFRDGKIRFSR